MKTQKHKDSKKGCGFPIKPFNNWQRFLKIELIRTKEFLRCHPFVSSAVLVSPNFKKFFENSIFAQLIQLDTMAIGQKSLLITTVCWVITKNDCLVLYHSDLLYLQITVVSAAAQLEADKQGSRSQLKKYNIAAFKDSSCKTQGIEVKDGRNCGYVEMEELRWAILHVLSLINESKDESDPRQQEHNKIQQNTIAES